MMRYALLEHLHGTLGYVNIGDHIQSCAAKQFTPKVDFYVERDQLNKKSYDKARIIMNGWFTHAPENWPPNENLEPLFISFHLNPSCEQEILGKNENVEYLKRHSPIGCRDHRTKSMLESYGIEAYFSFCLTTTLDVGYKSEEKSNEIIFVDPLYSYDFSIIKQASFKEKLSKIKLSSLKRVLDYLKPKPALTNYIPQEIIQKAVVIDQLVETTYSTNELYEKAEEIIKRYSKAKLVVTSRIHCALPCLALGTPVLFILEGLKDESEHLSRFRGILNHINILTKMPKDLVETLFNSKMNVFHPDEIDWENPPKNPNSHIELSDKLKKTCTEFMQDN
jgi:hypothetical protein